MKRQKVARVVGPKQERRLELGQEIGGAAAIGTHDHQSVGQGFEHGQAERFVRSGREEDVALPIDLGHAAAVADVSQELEVRLGHGGKLVIQRPAADDRAVDA